MSYVANITLAPNGRVVIPANMRAELGCAAGGTLLARLENGTIILEPVQAAVRRAQALVGQYVAPDANLADELIAERKAAAAIE